MYHLKLIPETTRLNRVNDMLGNDEEAWWTYHCLRGRHVEDYHHLKREIEILIQRGRFTLSAKFSKEQKFVIKRSNDYLGSSHYHQETHIVLSGPPHHSKDKLSHKTNPREAKSSRQDNNLGGGTV